MNCSTILRSLTAALFLTLFFCGLAQSELRTITVAENGNLDNLDPTLFTTTAPINLAMNIGDPLVRVVNGEVVPVLAESWDSPTPDRYVLHLRKGVLFHDGSPFTAQDVKFTLDRILDPATRSGLLPYVALIESVEVIDDHTVEIQLSEPQVTFLSNLARGIVMISKDAFERLGAGGFAEAPVATGPFKVASWDRTTSWVLEAHDEYWQGRAEIDRVIFRVIPEVSTQVAGLLAGELDITSSIGYDTAELIDRSTRARTEMATGLYQEMVILNTNHPPFDDVRVRRALNHAIDFDAMIEGVYRGMGTRTTHPFTSSVFGFNPDIQAYEYNPDLAQQLLSEAGYADGFRAELLYPAGGGSTGAMGRASEVISAYLAEIGVVVSISAPERVEHSRRVYSDGTMDDMAIAQLITRTGDADFGLALYFDEGRRNHYFRDSTLTELVRQQLEETDLEARQAKLNEIAQYLHDQAPWIFIAEVPLLYGVSERLEWTASPDQVIYLYGARVR